MTLNTRRGFINLNIKSPCPNNLKLDSYPMEKIELIFFFNAQAFDSYNLEFPQYFTTPFPK